MGITDPVGRTFWLLVKHWNFFRALEFLQDPLVAHWLGQPQSPGECSTSSALGGLYKIYLPKDPRGAKPCLQVPRGKLIWISLEVQQVSLRAALFLS